MPYYETLEEDLKRAREILEKGRPEEPLYKSWDGKMLGGTIFGADIYAAYKLLESFVEELERIQREKA